MAEDTKAGDQPKKDTPKPSRRQVMTRNWDGSPETPEDKKFHDLRDSGYTGPIDQNGNKDTTSEGAATLRRMAKNRGEHVDW